MWKNKTTSLLNGYNNLKMKDLDAKFYIIILKKARKETKFYISIQGKL